MTLILDSVGYWSMESVLMGDLVVYVAVGQRKIRRSSRTAHMVVGRFWLERQMRLMFISKFEQVS